ncbi:hypothetical protein Hdeb2414_s0022g00618151 [Helianthus debilis subsp. tardiflorus]
MYADYGITSDDNQRLARKKHWLITEGFGAFLSAVSQSEEFKSGLEEVYRAYRDVGYQAGLKDGYAYSAQGLGRKETPLYNSKAKKRLSKLDEEFGSKTPAILKKILEHPMISIDELKALFPLLVLRPRCLCLGMPLRIFAKDRAGAFLRTFGSFRGKLCFGLFG